MKEKQVTRHGCWHVATAIGVTGRFVAWAKMGPILADDPITEPGEYVWFEFGETRQEAAERLLTELGLIHGEYVWFEFGKTR